MSGYARSHGCKMVGADETVGSVETSIIDDHGGIILGRTVVVDLAQDAGWRIDRPRRGCCAALSLYAVSCNDGRSVSRLGIKRQAVIRRERGERARRLHDVCNIGYRD